ncbi:hypothetical protein DSO57_1028001 [Entomophthora muscae]|uniref:Uncharacterized protein n=1 Tax=Entomophthora muscae TaxID=34485 RepID=A0ACC2TNS9_9FUNG|nr:hypothetical protein DSO57_1028001 [Entomophthora muscae]
MLEPHLKRLDQDLDAKQPRLSLAPHMPKHHISYVTEYTDEHCYWHFPRHEINHLSEKGGGQDFYDLTKGSPLHDMVLKCQRE